MSGSSLKDRMAEIGLRLPEADMAAFAEIVADTDRIAAAIRNAALSYADEPAIFFAAPRG